jgi:GTP-binding protein EngB required for normal cell division
MSVPTIMDLEEKTVSIILLGDSEVGKSTLLSYVDLCQ